MLNYWVQVLDAPHQEGLSEILVQAFPANQEVDSMVTIAQHLRAEGRKQGIEQGKEEIAQKLHEKGVSLIEISEIVEISVEKLKPKLEAKIGEHGQL